jgi:hypothetical protein
MITEDYISFETAKLLKEKGFDKKCFTVYNTDGKFYDTRYGIAPSIEIPAPTLQMAMKWLREVHNYDVGVCLDSYVEPYDNLYYIVIRRRKDKYENISPCEQAYYDTYEEACEAAIKYCLENLI